MSGVQLATYNDVAECTTRCNLIESRLVEVEEAIARLEKSASTFMNEDIRNLISELMTSRDSLRSQAKNVASSIKPDMVFADFSNKNSLSVQILEQVNELSVVRVKAIDNALQNMLHESIISADSPRAVERTDLSSFLKSVEDKEVAGMIRLLVRNSKYDNSSLEEIKGVAEGTFDPDNAISVSDAEQIRSDMIAEMKANKVSEKKIQEVLDTPPSSSNILEIVNFSSEAIISENVRKNTIKSIVANITDKGFVVDKKNIRHIKDENMVKITALKPGGQFAEFNVKLDGSFIYKFDGYEGQACQKDIQPFLADLESIYGIKITDSKEIWSNPDKIMSKSYQKMNVNRGV